MLQGSCVCGDVRFDVAAPPLGASMCHCGQCRKQSGGIWSSAHVATSDLVISGEVRWFEASTIAKRGSCARCGSFLFWKAHDEELISFALGAIDGPTGLTLGKHIFVADKGDYYDISDGVEQRD